MISIAIDQEWNSEKSTITRNSYIVTTTSTFSTWKKGNKQWIPREYEKIVAVSSYQGRELTKSKSARTKSAPDEKLSIVFGRGSWSEMQTVLEITVIVLTT